MLSERAPQEDKPHDPTEGGTLVRDECAASTQGDSTNTFACAAGPESLSRLHPTSLLFDVISHGRAYIIPAIIAIFSAASGSMLGVWLAAFIFVPAIVVSIFRYITLRYRIQDGQLIVTEGLFFRRVRAVPVGRIQNIDLVQNVLHRLFAVAEVRIETASGSEPEAKLRVLSMRQVAELRSAVAQIRAVPSAERVKTAWQRSLQVDDELGGQPADTLLLSIPLRWLVSAGLASNRGMLIVGLIAGAIYEFDLEERIDFERLRDLGPAAVSTVATIAAWIVAIILLLLIVRVLGIVWYILRFYGYRLSRCGEDLRVACGLLTKVSATVPRHRIQFISVHRTLFMRWMGLAAIRIETAGGAGKQNEDASTTVARRWFIPVVPADRVPQLLHELRPGLKWDEANLVWQPLSSKAGRRLIRLAIIQCGILVALGIAVDRQWGWAVGIVALPSLIWWAMKKSRSMRYARFDTGVVYRSGVFNRKTSLTFFEKIQTLCLDQSPFDRRWQMARLTVDTAAAGPADHRIDVPLLDEVFAREEFRELVARAG